MNQLTLSQPKTSQPKTTSKKRKSYEPLKMLRRGDASVSGLQFYLDTSKKKSRCRTCRRDIEKGERRFVIMQVHPWRSTGTNGAGHNTTRLFFHPRCMRAMANTRTKTVGIKCDFCSATDTSLVQAHDGSGTSHPTLNGTYRFQYDFKNLWLCRKHLGPYDTCRGCGQVWLRSLMSPTINPEKVPYVRRSLGKGSLICLRCEERDNFLTERTQIRDRIEFSTLQGLRTKLGDGALALDDNETLEDLFADKLS